MLGARISEENSLSTLLESSSSESLLGRAIKGVAEGLYTEDREEKDLVKQQQDALAVVMPLNKEYPDVSFGGVGILDGKLFIATYSPYNTECS